MYNLPKESSEKIEEKVASLEGWNAMEVIGLMALCGKVVADSGVSKDEAFAMAKKQCTEIAFALEAHEGQGVMELS